MFLQRVTLNSVFKCQVSDKAMFEHCEHLDLCPWCCWSDCDKRKNIKTVTSRSV